MRPPPPLQAQQAIEALSTPDGGSWQSGAIVKREWGTGGHEGGLELRTQMGVEANQTHGAEGSHESQRGANGDDCSYKAIGSDGKPLRRQRDMETGSKALKNNFLRALGAME